MTNRWFQIGLILGQRPPGQQPNPRWKRLGVKTVNVLNHNCTRNRPFLRLNPELIVSTSQYCNESIQSQRQVPSLRGRGFLLRPQVVSGQRMFQWRLRRVGVRSLKQITVTRLGTLIRTPAPRIQWTNRRFQVGLIVEPRRQPNPHWEGPKTKVVNVWNRHRTSNRQFPSPSPDLIVADRQQSNESSRSPRLMRKRKGVVIPAHKPSAASPVTGARVRTRTTWCESRVRRQESRSIRVWGRKCGRTALAAWKSICGQGGFGSGATGMAT